MISRETVLKQAGVWLSILGTLGGTAFAQITPPPAPVPPAFSKLTLGRTAFRGNNMETSLHVLARANPFGEITGAEFLNLARPLDRATFERMVKDRAGKDEKPDYDKLYQDYLNTLTRQAFAVLRLSRILDNEAGKNGLGTKASFSRVYFVVRSIIVAQTIRMKKVPEGVDATEWLRSRSDAELYAFLTEAAGEHNVRFNIDWQYRDGGLEGMFRHIHGSEAEWPAVTLSFPKLPKSVEDFRAQIQEKLQPTHLQLTRVAAWQKYVREYESAAKRRVIWGIPRGDSPADLQRLYDGLKDTVFRVQDSTASVDGVVIGGAKAAQFAEKLVAHLTERQKELMKEVFGDGTSTTPPTDEEAKAIRAKIIALRKRIPIELIEATKADFGPEIAADEITVEEFAKSYTLEGGKTLPSDDAVESQLMRAALDPVFEATSLLPNHQVKEAKTGKIQMIFLRETLQGEPRSLPFSDRRVRDALEARASSRYQAFMAREAAYELLKYNPFGVSGDTCSDPAWPCLEKDARILTEALFPERRLVPAAAGEPSSLGNPKLIPLIADINSDLFGRVLQAPNAIREPH